MTLLLSKPEKVEEVRIHRTLTTSPAGMIQRRNVYPAHYPFLRQWRLGWSVAGLDDKNEIIQLFRDTRGSGTFTWIPPGETTAITVRFVSDTISWEASSLNAHQITITVEEMR